MRYVNVYTTYREYGGPEEGGWYYTVGNPLDSARARSEADEKRLHAKFSKEYQNGYPGMADDERIEIRTESHPAKAFPEKTPHYE